MYDLFAVDTLSDARASLENSKESGDSVKCPCCEQTVKVYPRKILGTMVMQLRDIISNGRRDAKDLPFLSSGGVYAQMRYWGLIEQNDDATWSATQKGVDFLHDRISVPSTAFVFNQTLLGFSDDTVGVRDCMGKKFDYDEMMSKAEFPREFIDF